LITCVLLGEPDCSTYGICKRSDNASVCVCNGGFTGDDCSEFICPGTISNDLLKGNLSYWAETKWGTEVRTWEKFTASDA
jgi:hypothetical protein